LSFCRKIFTTGIFCLFLSLDFYSLSFAEEFLPTTPVLDQAEVINEETTNEVEKKEIGENALTKNEENGIASHHDEETLLNEKEDSSQVPSVQEPIANIEVSASIEESVSSNTVTTVVPQFLPSDKYFKVIQELVPIYDNSSGSLIQVGYLNKDQAYPRLADYGDWHQIKYGQGFGYVWEGSTIPAQSVDIKNLNLGLLNSNNFFISTEPLIVYDNTSGLLVPFAKINKGIHYPFISEMGDWYQIDVSGRVGYVYKPATIRQFSSSDSYFEVTENLLSVYDNRSGSLTHVGYLNKGQVYPRIADYGDWHQIKFGSGYGYVWESGTRLATPSSIKNLNVNLKNTTLFFKADVNLPVYDNSTGSLVPFATILKGIQYPIIGDFGEWYQIDISGRIGYVYKPATTRPFNVSDRYFEVTDNQLPIYENHSGSLELVGYLYKGEVYPRDTDYGDWHQLKFGNRYGYVWKAGTKPATASSVKNINVNLQNTTLSFNANVNLPVYDNSTGSLVPFATIHKDTQYPIISDYGDWYQIDISGRIGYVYKSATTRLFNSTDQYFEVIEENVPIFDNRSGQLKQVGYLNKGEIYPRISDYGDWHQVNFGNRYGYVWKGSTKPAFGNSIKNINPNLQNADLYFKANLSMSVYDNSSGILVPFATIFKDNLYPVISDIGDWYQIDISGRIGYVYKEGVEIVSEPSIYGKVIVLDAGHGGSDPGAMGINNLEKTLTLQTVNKLAALLKEAGATVILTRETDIYLPLSERVEISRKFNPDAFISVHYNSFTNPGTNGIETYYYSVTKDKLLANVIHKAIMEQVSLRDRGVRFGDYHVLRENSQTAILLELGFISNFEEENIIASSEFQNIVVKGIFNGLKNYFY
jgi:N-acetylmuramoyl-L-alanine amidase